MLDCICTHNIFPLMEISQLERGLFLKLAKA